MSPHQRALKERLARVGRTLGEREAAHRAELDEARVRASTLRCIVDEGLAGYRDGIDSVGAPQLDVELSDIRLDDKHVRAVEFELSRGRHRAIVTVKSRGEVTLVGPFRAGKVEGPCKSFPFEAEDELHEALGAFLERFLEEAATP